MRSDKPHAFINIGDSTVDLLKFISEHGPSHLYSIVSEKHKGLSEDKVLDKYFIPHQESHEDYEKADYDDELNKFYDEINSEFDDVWIVIETADYETGCLLKFCERLDVENIHVLCVEPDLDFLSQEEKKINRLVKNVVQEYARSDMFQSALMINKERVYETMSDVPIAKYNQRIEETIGFYFFSYMFYEKNGPFIGTSSKPEEVNRIRTIGILNEQTGGEFPFFQFEAIRETHYYYPVSKDAAESDSDLIKLIKQDMKERRESGREGLTFGIYKSKVKEPTPMFMNYTSIPQGFQVQNQPKTNQKRNNYEH